MKNILFLLALVCFVFTSCQKEEEFDDIDIAVIEDEPQEINPEISFRAVDVNGTPLTDVKLQIFDEGTQKLEVFTDDSGSVTAQIPSETLEKRLLMLGEKAIYNDNILRIEPEQIEAGIVEIVLTPVEETTPINESNVSSLLSSDVVLVNGRVTDAVGNPGGFIVYIYELDAILNGDTTLFQNYVYLDGNGSYEMLVPVDVELVVSIFEFDPCSADQFRTINAQDVSFPDGFFGENIGTFTEDTTLPTNTNAGQITGQPVDLTFTRSVVDCDGLPIENSMVRFFTVDFTGGTLIGSVNTNSDGSFSRTLNVGCVGFPSYVAVINSPNTPPFSYSTAYNEGEDTVEFGEMESCGQSSFTISNHINTTDQITNNNLILAAYEEDVSVTITANTNATDQFLLTGEKMPNGFWTGTGFEFYQNGTLLYRGNQDFLLSLIDDGDRVRINLIGIEVEILSGPDAGTLGALFNGTGTIFK